MLGSCAMKKRINMVRNSIRRAATEIIGQAVKMLSGLTQLGAALKITQITPAEFQAELSAFVTADGEYNAARSAKQSASDSFKPADSALSVWLQTTRNVLAARFGNRWSTLWAQAGFINNTTSIPSRVEDRLGLALSLANFFTLNPSYEVASLGVTATHATTLRSAALGAQQAVMAADVTLKSKGDAYDVIYSALTDTMRSLVSILRATLDDSDPRWLAFGLVMPSTNQTPGQPVNVTAHLDEMGAIVVQCDAVPLATRYRWRMLRVGVETEYQLAARSVDPLGSIPGVLDGQTVRLIVQAVNGNLQGVASDPIEFTMPLQAKEAIRAAAIAASASVEPAPATSRRERSGQPNGSRLPAMS